MNIWFTSDTHYNYHSLDKYNVTSNLGTKPSTEQMIENWNRVVDKGDTIYHLGDFSEGLRLSEIDEILAKLNGKKHLILGNHDTTVANSREWLSVSPLKDIRIKYLDRKGVTQYQEITLCHYAMKVWRHSGRGSWQLYGHSHGSLPEETSSFQLDVGMDANNMMPISFFQVKRRMEKKSYLPKDYHGYAGVSTIPEHIEEKEKNRAAALSGYNYNYSWGSYQNQKKDFDWEKKWDNIFEERG